MAVVRDNPDAPLVMGRIAAPYGVKGWVRVVTFTETAENLLSYSPWYLRRDAQWREVRVLDGREHGKGLVVQLEGIGDRDAAAAMSGTDVGVYRSQLPPPDADEYYWSDLTGLQVFTTEDRLLGVVDHLIATGANDVLVIRGEREYLVPFVRGQVIKSIDLAAGVMRVDWDPDF
ncbi:MAG TPA: ribosome maturation factor RimM [Gammaproteobacteria bacterium]|nr:ribosome maturation factor RimM [Gammaproteobacteria bacterium]